MLKFKPIAGIDNWEMTRFIPYHIRGAKGILDNYDIIKSTEFKNDFKVTGVKVTDANVDHFIGLKMGLLRYVQEYFSKNKIPFDVFNGLAPTRVNEFKGYEFGALWLWGFLISVILGDDHSKRVFTDKRFYDKFGNMISVVFKKYPVTTSSLLYEFDLHYPGNKLMDYANMDDADFDSDTQEGWDNAKADEFNDWLISWCNRASSHDKMRVTHWFETRKSHKQIFAEINKVVGNSEKFNARLALFLERLLNNDNLDYFYSKSGFDSKEDLYMAYLGKLDMFDDASKHSFIRKYLLKGEDK